MAAAVLTAGNKEARSELVPVHSWRHACAAYAAMQHIWGFHRDGAATEL